MTQFNIIFTKQYEYIVKAKTEEEALNIVAKQFEKDLDETGPYTYDVEVYEIDTSKLS